jgi:hypothetical protein
MIRFSTISRWTVRCVTVASIGAALILISAAWLRSRWRCDEIWRRSGADMLQFDSSSGSLGLAFYHYFNNERCLAKPTMRPTPAIWGLLTEPKPLALRPSGNHRGFRSHFDLGGFVCASGSNQSVRGWYVIAPWWSVWMPMAIVTVLAGMRLRPTKQPRLGFCLTCGYDLRATPDRCPECGMAVAHKPDAFPRSSGL